MREETELAIGNLLLTIDKLIAPWVAVSEGVAALALQGLKAAPELIDSIVDRELERILKEPRVGDI